jgi:thiosulfate/3-mercaptopyruvate sulfurtransferase
MGFKNVGVLDGGLPQWVLENRTTVPTLSNIPPENGNIYGVYQAKLVCTADDIMENISSKKQVIIDARSPARFLGEADEPRAGVRSGHIPNSLNLPFAQILDNHRFKEPQQLSALFSTLVPNKDNEVIFTCGSGITACIIMLAAVIADYQQTVLYDGSWSDWGSNASLPVDKG